jgi:hypothetical protein
LHLETHLHPYALKGDVESDTVIAVLDYFATQTKEPEVVELHNAFIHMSGKFQNPASTWAAQDVCTCSIARFSPELNLIRISAQD